MIGKHWRLNNNNTTLGDAASDDRKTLASQQQPLESNAAPQWHCLSNYPVKTSNYSSEPHVLRAWASSASTQLPKADTVASWQLIQSGNFLKGCIAGVDTQLHSGFHFLFFSWPAGLSAGHAPSVVIWKASIRRTPT